MKLVDLEIDVLIKALREEAKFLVEQHEGKRELPDEDRITYRVLSSLAAALSGAAHVQADPQRRTFGEQVDQFLANLPE
jgi:hypothetical protein